MAKIKTAAEIELITEIELDILQKQVNYARFLWNERDRDSAKFKRTISDARKRLSKLESVVLNSKAQMA